MPFPIHSFFCWTHFYKILVTVVLLFMALQCVFNVFYNQRPINDSLFFVGNIYQVHHNRSPYEDAFTTRINENHNETMLRISDSVSVPGTNINLSNTTNTIGEIHGLNNEVSLKASLEETTVISPTTLPPCPLISPHLEGRVAVLKEAPSMAEIDTLHPDLKPGGHFIPSDCISKHRVAIIVPYRDRAEHLRVFLYNIHPILKKQQIEYGIYVVEQVGTATFNRAMLMNIGFLEASKEVYNYGCFIFHDVDLIPEDDRNIYSCPEEQPRHMSVAVDVFNYRLPYTGLFGGVGALSRDQFIRLNGFSNQFWGWGGEDDDMANRIKHHKYHISRYPANIARYQMLDHKKDRPNPKRYEYLYSGKHRFTSDGINSVKYERVDFLLKRLYTWVYVKLPERTGS